MSVEYMTGTRTGKSEEQTTREIYDSIKKARGVEELLQTYDGTGKSDENNAKLRKLVFDDKRSKGMQVPASADDLPLDDARNYATAHDGMLNTLYQIAHNNTRDGLEAVMNKADEKKLEGLLGNKEAMEEIAPHADSKGHEDWAKHYSAYQHALKTRDKAKVGALEDEERKDLLIKRALATGEKTREIVSKLGIDKAKQEFYVNQSVQSVFSTSNAKDYVKAAEDNLKSAEQELRKYETDSGKDAKTYLGSAIRNMLDKPAQVSHRALSYLEAIKK